MGIIPRSAEEQELAELSKFGAYMVASNPDFIGLVSAYFKVQEFAEDYSPGEDEQLPKGVEILHPGKMNDVTGLATAFKENREKAGFKVAGVNGRLYALHEEESGKDELAPSFEED